MQVHIWSKTSRRTESSILGETHRPCAAERCWVANEGGRGKQSISSQSNRHKSELSFLPCSSSGAPKIIMSLAARVRSPLSLAPLTSPKHNGSSQLLPLTLSAGWCSVTGMLCRDRVRRVSLVRMKTSGSCLKLRVFEGRLSIKGWGSVHGFVLCFAYPTNDRESRVSAKGLWQLWPCMLWEILLLLIHFFIRYRLSVMLTCV